jgi:hypothetical protein
VTSDVRDMWQEVTVARGTKMCSLGFVWRYPEVDWIDLALDRQYSVSVANKKLRQDYKYELYKFFPFLFYSILFYSILFHCGLFYAVLITQLAVSFSLL